MLRAIGVFDQGNKISESFAEKLIFVADNMERVVVVAGTAVTAYGTLYVGAMLAAKVATIGVTGALGLLRGAIIKTGIGIILIALGELVYQLVKAREASDSWGEAFSKVAGRLGMVWDGIKTGFQALTEYMEAAWYSMLAKLFSSTNTVLGKVFALFGISKEDMQANAGMFALFADTASRTAADTAASAAEKIKGVFAGFDLPAGTVNLNDDGGGGIKQLGEMSKAAARVKKAYEDLMISAKGRVAQTKLEADSAHLAGIAQETLRFKLDLLQKVEEKRLTLSPKMRQTLMDQVDAFEKYANAAAKATLTQDLLFERAQMGRSAIEQTIASTLRGAGLEVNFNSVEAGIIRTNEQLKIARDLSQDFAQGFVSDILNGTSALDALLNGLSKIADKLIQMAMDDLFASAFGGSGSGGLLGSLFGIGGGIGSGSAQFAASGGIGLFASGGHVSGPGSGTSDSVLARLSNGEFVVNSASAKLYGPLLEAINDNKLPAFRDGGGVGSYGDNVIPMPTPASIPNRAGGGSASSSKQNVHVTVEVSVDQKGNLQAAVKHIAQQEAYTAAAEVVKENNRQREDLYFAGGNPR